MVNELLHEVVINNHWELFTYSVSESFPPRSPLILGCGDGTVFYAVWGDARKKSLWVNLVSYDGGFHPFGVRNEYLR